MLRLGLALPNQFAPGSSLAAGVGLALRAASTGRGAGFDALLAGEHRLSDPYPYCAPTPLLARAAAEVDDMDLIAMSLLALHHPIDVAEDLATLDAVSRGRTILCAALGYRKLEYDAFGLDWSHRVERLEEAMCLVGELCRADRIDFAGSFFTIPSAPVCSRPDQAGGIPIWRAASADRAIARAGAAGATWLIGPSSDNSTLADQQQLYVAAGGDRTELVPIVREVIVTPSRERAVELAKRYLWPKYRTYREWGHDRAIGRDETFEKPQLDLGGDRFILGDVEDAVQSVLALVRDLHVNLLIVHPHWPGLADEDALTTITLMGREVLPEVRATLARDGARHQEIPEEVR